MAPMIRPVLLSSSSDSASSTTVVAMESTRVDSAVTASVGAAAPVSAVAVSVGGLLALFLLGRRGELGVGRCLGGDQHARCRVLRLRRALDGGLDPVELADLADLDDREVDRARVPSAR